MKWFIYPILLFLAIHISSCKSVENFYEESQYDKVINTISKTLEGGKGLNEHELKILELSFNKMNAKDLTHIDLLKNKATNGDITSLQLINKYVSSIDMRQNKILPYLSINRINKTNFEIVQTSIFLADLKESIASRIYDDGMILLNEVHKKGLKEMAKRANGKFSIVPHFSNKYTSIDSLLELSLNLATTNVLLTTKHSNGPFNLESSLVNMGNSLGSKWTSFHTEAEEGVAYDLHSVVEIKSIDISPNNQSQNTTIEYIQAPVSRTNTAAISDSTSSIPRFGNRETVQVMIHGISRNKSTKILAEMITYDSKDIIDSKEFFHEVKFKSEGCEIYGDAGIQNQLNNNLQRCQSNLEEFPTNDEMTQKVLDDLSEMVMRHLIKIDFGVEAIVSN